MAQLIYEITGDISGLQSALNQASNIIRDASAQSSEVKLNVPDITPQIKAGVSALDQLDKKLAVIQGNGILFGDSIKLQSQEVNAYQSAINSLLSNGFDPMDGDVTRLKTKIDALTESIAAQNAVAVKQPTSTISDKTQFTEPSIDTGSSTAGLTGTEVLLRDLNKDLAAGTITAEEYAAAVAQIGQQTTVTSVKIEQEIGILAGLKAELASLKSARLNIVNPADLTKQNALIQELEAEISRLGNAGRTGFDASGNAVQSFGRNVQNAGGAVENLGRGLTRGLGFLRQLAFILPGIGVAGIFNLAFEAIASAANGLQIFSTKATQASSNLEALNAVQKTSSQEIGKQLGPLQSLFDATQNVNLSIERRLAAAQQLRDLYPTEFQNTTNLAIVNGQLKDSYDQLTQSIIRNAVAQGAEKQVEAEAAKAAAATIQIQKIRNQQAGELSRVSGNISASAGTGGGGAGGAATEEQQRANIIKRANDAVVEQNKIINNAQGSIKFLEKFVQDYSAAGQKLDDANKLLGNNLQNFNSLLEKSTDKQQFENIKNALQTKLDSLAPNDPQIANLRAKILQVEEIIKNAYDVKLTKGTNVDPFIAIGNSITELLNKINAKTSESGLTGYLLAVEKIKAGYTEINTALDKQQQKLTNLQKAGLSPAGQSEKDNLQVKLDTARSANDSSLDKQLNDAKITEAKRVVDEIQRINDEFGVRADVSRSRELAQVQKMYDAEVVKAQGNKDILNALNADRIIAITAIDDKYIQQEQQTYDRITDIANQAFQQLATGEEARTDKINLESQKRITQANAEFNKLRDLAKGLPQSTTDNINNIQAQVNLVIKAANIEQVSEEISKNFASAMQSAVQGFVSNFFTSLTTLGQTRQDIDNKYKQQLQQQQVDYANSIAAADGKITDAQNQVAINQINNLKKLEQESTTSFGAIFSSLVSKFNSTFNESILSSFTKQFTENLGKTLIAPSAKQLSISPQEQAAQNVAASLKTAGDSLAVDIKQSGVDFANSIKGASVNPLSNTGVNASGQLVPLNTGIGSFTGDFTSATNNFTHDVTGAGEALGTGVTAAATTAAITTTAAADTAAAKTVGAASQLSSKLAAAAAAASLAGGLISGLGKPTNSVTSGLGGALQGAGEGAVIGTAIAPGIGTIIGGVAGGIIGGISGLLGASKAKKQEELQQKQLEQQQETNELLARQNALAYTTSIIGRMTTQGIVTGADINSFGELTATVSGKSLQFVLGRTNNGR